MRLGAAEWVCPSSVRPWTRRAYPVASSAQAVESPNPVVRRVTSMRRIELAICIALCAVAGALGACGGGGDDSSSTTTTSAADLDRFCAAIGELDAASNKIFAQLRQGGQISSDQLAAAEKKFLQQNADTVQELEQVAPEEIRADLATSIEASRVRAGLASGGPTAAEETAAAQHVREFRKQNCPAG